MQADQAGIGKQAFGDNADDLVTITYKSHQDALKFIKSVLRESNGVGIVHGPSQSGKTTIVRRLAEQLPRDTAVAIIDGARIKPRELLSGMLSQFGYHTGLEATEELLKMVNIFSVQQTRSCQAPVLFVDNADRMYPSALRMLNTLAAIAVQGRFAIRIILTGRDGLRVLVDSESLTNIAKRNFGIFLMSPLSIRETMIYLHARLLACGVQHADAVFPVDVCDRLCEQSGGVPGELNRCALAAIERASEFPVKVADTWEHRDSHARTAPVIPVLEPEDAVDPGTPRLIVTRDSKTMSEFTFKDKKVVIGRSDFADIVIEDEFASKMHALFLLYSDALVLLDLNSANGTTVNATKVRTTLLQDNDIISIGHHRLKVRNAPAISSDMAKLLQSPDTVKMRSLVELRRQDAQRNNLTAV